MTAEGEPDADALAGADRRPAGARRPAARRVAAGHRHGRRQQRRRPCSTTSRTAPPRPDGAGFAEDRLIRGLHPQIAERLQLDRLREFDLTRLPSADEEIYLFRAVAKSNPADERLIAMSQVRDLTPLREADGRLVALPALENVLAALPGRDPHRAGAAAAEQALRHQPGLHLRLAARAS